MQSGPEKSKNYSCKNARLESAVYLDIASIVSRAAIVSRVPGPNIALTPARWRKS